MTLPTAIEQYCVQSFANAAGGMFWRDEQLCSGAVGRNARLLKLLWEEGLIEELRKLGLVAEFEAIHDADMQYEFALGLRRSFRISYCYEWCDEMWKAGALYLINLLKELASFQLTIENLQPHYLLFDGTRPVYVNPASFCHLTKEVFAHTIERLSASLLYPVVLASSGKSHPARRLLRGITEGIRVEDFSELKEVAERVTTWAKTLSPPECLQKLQNEVEQISFVDVKNEWSEYYSIDPPLIPSENWSKKHYQVYQVLIERSPESVLDLACNVGRYSRLATTVAADVIAVDFDETCVNRLYRRVQSTEPQILPILMDITDPSPAFGVGNSWLAPASIRFQADLVLALAVSHHLVFSGWKLTIDELVRAFSPFARRWLLVEWIPFDSNGMVYSTYDRPESATWYDLDSFVAALAKHFSRIDVLPCDPHSRQLVLCER